MRAAGEAEDPLMRTLEEGEHGDDAGRRDVDGELVLPDGELLHVFGQAAHHPGAVLVEVLGLGRKLIGRVDDGGLQLAGGSALHGSKVLSVFRLADRESGQLRDGGREASRLSDAGLSQAGQGPASVQSGGHRHGLVCREMAMSGGRVVEMVVMPW